ncbi:hypothetical protein, partial [Streptomyces sp. NPDC088141]|uniref:hypothetical protein n=1 Tax=Streptomyces sp. NPDC088141 TaxID=3155179 RepID=UPI0034184F8E
MRCAGVEGSHRCLDGGRGVSGHGGRAPDLAVAVRGELPLAVAAVCRGYRLVTTLTDARHYPAAVL